MTCRAYCWALGLELELGMELTQSLCAWAMTPRWPRCSRLWPLLLLLLLPLLQARAKARARHQRQHQQQLLLARGARPRPRAVPLALALVPRPS